MSASSRDAPSGAAAEAARGAGPRAKAAPGAASREAASPRETARTVRLGAALFNGDHGRLSEEIARLEASGIDFVHLDVFDGYFVPDVGFSPHTIAALRPHTRLPFEVHLGVNEPARFIPALSDAGCDLILVHVESARMLFETIHAVHSRGVKAGVVLALATAVSAAEPILGRLEALLLLSRVTGEGSTGASFDPAVIPRLRAVREMAERAGAKFDLQAAGGVNRTNAASLVSAGATSLALGAGIYRVADMREEVDAVRARIARTEENE